MIVNFLENIEIISGGTPKTSVDEYWNGDIPWISIDDFKNSNRYVLETSKYITNKGLEKSATNLLHKNDIIISARGSVGKIALIKKDMAFNQSCFGLRVKNTKINPVFLFYYLRENVYKLLPINHGSTFDTINTKTFETIKIDLPDRPIQDKIVEILSNIDNQIERNNEMTKRLQVLGNTIYSKNVKETNDFFIIDESKIKTGKQDANFATPNGNYKFFTCSEDSFLCDSYEFDGKNILIAGNGNFNVKFYDGKFNAYQRTYVIKDDTIYGNLYYTYSYNTQSLLKGANGSIIKFMTIGMLKDIPIPDFSREVNDALNNIVYEINKIKQENDNLNQLKSKLLPLLINGQVNI